MSKIYPDSHVEISGLLARYYDSVMNVLSGGSYGRLIASAVKTMDIQPGDHILDMGCGTGRNACLMQKYLGTTGHILGVDISEEMGRQFRQKCSGFNNMTFAIRRVDIPCAFETPFDKVFMSFVLHGFPHDVRQIVLQNIYDSLKPGGVFCLFDYNEFTLAGIPSIHRWVFKTIECKYAYDFVEHDWKNILSEFGFEAYREKVWFRRYIRLLKAVKPS